MNADWNKEEHPNWYKDVPTMRSLILGSFPPHHSKCAYPFFYPTLRNRFWKILADLAGESLKWTKTDNKSKAVQERFEIMKKLKIGVQNLGLEIERKGKSALDTNIKITKYQDIVKKKKNYIEQQGIKYSAINKLGLETAFIIQLKGRSIECVILNSTSTASRIKYDFLLDQFRRHLK